MGARITARGLSFQLPDGRELFTDLDLSLGAGLTALVGPNGIGKTCLARLLAGELAPAAGALHRQVPVTLLPQRQVPQPLPVREFLGAEHEWSRATGQLLQGVEHEALCTTLSGGQWMRVRLAQLLCGHYLILDEPTNDLDREGREAVAGFLRQHGGGSLVISHDLGLLESCQDILELSTQGLASFRGGWTAYTQAKQEEEQRLGAALEAAKRERDAARDRQAQLTEQRLQRSVRGAAATSRQCLPALVAGARKRAAQVTTGKLGTRALERSQEAVRAAHEALSRLKVEPVMYARGRGEPVPPGKLVAEARGFNVCFGDWIYPRDLDFSWRGSVRIALHGANGSGKTTLLRALLGETFKTRGTLRSGALATLYADQRCSGLDDNTPLLEQVMRVARGPVSEIRTALAAFLFPEDKVFQKVGEMSGGERLRAALALGFLGAGVPELLVLDEPTNNLDLVNVAFLQRLVSGFQGALLMISHDEAFLRSCNVTGELRLDAP